MNTSEKPYIGGGVLPSPCTSDMLLTTNEAHALGWRLMARHAADWWEVLDWEDVPELDEHAWEQVASEMNAVADWLSHKADRVENEMDTDSRDLLSRARLGGST